MRAMCAIECPYCGEVGRVPSELIGERVACPECGKKFIGLRARGWARAMVESPVLHYWWLLPAMIIFCLWWLRAVALWPAIALWGLLGMIEIARRLRR